MKRRQQTPLKQSLLICHCFADQYIGHLLQASLSLAVLRFTRDLQEGCMWNTRATPIPVRIMEPVYGQLEPSFQDFCLPGMIVT